MKKKVEKNSIIEICPVRNVIARFGNKWALLVILVLSESGQTRFNQLGKMIPDISTKVLANTLRVLEADKLVKRTVFPEVPIRVEYELTETGRTLVPIIGMLTEWAQQNMPSILRSRRKYEAAQHATA
ncbi:MAG: helix-turn-helix domain-containing protein [Bacteroidales bacterium]|nr:helix-turn-helix domain-containing protein [Bacteroidales bacterium]